MAESKKRHSTIKPWKQCTRQQKYNRKKFLVHDVEEALNFCESKGFKLQSVEFQNANTGEVDVLDISTGKFCDKENLTTSLDDRAHSLLYVKDKSSISNKAFHELASIVPALLPKCGQVKKNSHTLNSEIAIKRTPNNIMEVQQSLRLRLTSKLVEQAPRDGKDFPEE